MATLMVLLERDEDALRPASIAILRAARASATEMGATLYAVLPGCREHQDRWMTQAGEAGADKIILLGNHCPDAPWTWEDIGPELTALCDEFRPRLLLLEHGRNSQEIAARLATHIEALLIRRGRLRPGAQRCLIVDEQSAQRDRERSIFASELAVPVVATLCPPFEELARGEDDADVIFFEGDENEAAPPAPSTLVERKSHHEPLEAAEVIVTAGVGAKAYLPLVDELAAALGARRGATLSLFHEGLAHEDEVIDVARQCVAPSLYISCGASGSPEHLGAIAPGTTIVCLEQDPMSPIMRAASYGLIGSLEETLPALIAEARGGGS